VGLGTSSPQPLFVTSTVVIPADLILTGLALNIRDNTIPEGGSVTATVFTSPCGFTAPTATGLSVTIVGPNTAEDPNCFVIGGGSVLVTQGSLLSVQITTSQSVGALSRGVAATIRANTAG
jgi:hypothetical protein